MARLLYDLILALLLITPRVGAGQDAVWCKPTYPAASNAFTLGALDSLVGRFELVLVRRIPREYPDTTRGILELWRQDSSRVWFSRVFKTSLADSIRAVRPDLGRYLAGAFQVVPADTTDWWRRVASRNPEYPGVEWYLGRLRIGDRDVLDGSGYDLTVVWVLAGQFGGMWREDTGIAVTMGPTGPLPNAEGYFCARRLGA
jgi:hypothetical protein